MCWEGGSLWVAFVVGLGSTAPTKYLVAFAAILVSGATAGRQISAVVVYTFVAFAVVKIPLVNQLAAPTKTHAVMQRVHNWVRTRRRRVLAVIIAVVGAYLVTTGVGSV
jgi:hypothetical protein